MGLRGSLQAAALVLVGALTLGAGNASAQGSPCGSTPGLLCSTVTVPLDRSGAIPGTVGLHVEELPPTGPSQGAIFLVAGGPGQGSAHAFSLGVPAAASLFRFLFPGYTLVAYDDRGTGDSGLLDCPALQVSTSPAGQDLLASACAASIGPAATLYGTADHAADLDAVRQALGFDKIALYGVSYGTKLALAYAHAYPDHVSRLVLDSVLPTDLPDPFGANVARAMPATLNAFCASSCRTATPNYAADVVAVANRLGAKPAHGTVLLSNGTKKQDTLGGVEMLSLVIDADLNPGLAVQLPAAVHAARLGNMRPLLRLHVFDVEGSRLAASDLSFALFAATDCRDGPFPWPASSDPASRSAILQSAIAALPPGTFGPFGPWAAGLGNAVLCDTWPSPAGGVDLAAGQLPNVPVLALSGGFDLRTPTAGAQSVVAQFPQGKLVVVPGIGHSVVLTDPSGCAEVAVHDWMLDPTRSDTCTRPPFEVAPIGAFPKSPSKRLGPQGTLALTSKTIAEAESAWLMREDSDSPFAVTGLAGGTLVPLGSSRFRLAGYGLVPGLTVSGTITIAPRHSVTLAFQGRLTVAGRMASAGRLQLVESKLSGTLGGRPVR